MTKRLKNILIGKVWYGRAGNSDYKLIGKGDSPAGTVGEWMTFAKMSKRKLVISKRLW